MGERERKCSRGETKTNENNRKEKGKEESAGERKSCQERNESEERGREGEGHAQSAQQPGAPSV